MRRHLLAGIGVGLIMVTGWPPQAQTAQPARPNIILIQADDLGYGDLSAYGQTQFQTPSLDRLAREGIRFTQYYAGSTVCAPSRSSLMTGQHTGHTCIRGNSKLGLRPEDVTIADGPSRRGVPDGAGRQMGAGRHGDDRRARTNRDSSTRSGSSISRTRTGSSRTISIETGRCMPRT